MGHETILSDIAIILLLGIGAQYLAWRLNLPAILFLLIAGFVAGPVTGILNPDKLLGGSLLPLVSLFVAIILFEGGLSLDFKEIHGTKRAVVQLLTVGLLITWMVCCAAAHYILKMDISLSLLLGAILTVTGPTVIGPLLRHINPVEKVNNVLKWEGIIIDPIGVLLTLLVFEIFFMSGNGNAWMLIAGGLFKTAVLATLIGALTAWFVTFCMARYWVPVNLQGVFALSLVVAAFISANYFQKESGLWAVTVMGVVLANQRKVSIRYIEDFKENLRILFISSLFVILAARFKLSQISHIDLRSWIFLGVLVFVARPLSVFVSMRRTKLNWRESAFIAWMAPRGVVAAAVSSVFVMRLSMLGYSQAEYWETMVFFVVVCSILLYSTTGGLVARMLKISNQNPQGALIIGAHNWARSIARAIQDAGIKALLVDTNIKNIRRANREGLDAVYGNVLSDEEIDINGLGRLLALTSNNDANSLIILDFIKLFGCDKVFQIHPEIGDGATEKIPRALRGRLLFSPELTYANFSERFASGAKVKAVLLTDGNFLKQNEKITPLCLVTSKKELVVFSTDAKVTPKQGDTLVYLSDTKLRQAI